jgi:hypothetical protein
MVNFKIKPPNLPFLVNFAPPVTNTSAPPPVARNVPSIPTKTKHPHYSWRARIAKPPNTKINPDKAVANQTSVLATMEDQPRQEPIARRTTQSCALVVQ